MKETFVLHSDSQAKALLEILSKRKEAVKLGKPLKVSITEEDKRTDAQNRMMHSMFGDLSKQVKWHGVSFSVLTWKRLCMASWLRSVEEKPQLIPALDGNGFDIVYERTSELGVKKGAEFIEWVSFFGDSEGVKWSKFGKLNPEFW